jgi:hypothetical protein
MRWLSCVAALFFTWTLGYVCAQEPVSSNSKLKQRDSGASVAEKKPQDESSLAMYFRELASQEKALADSYQRIAVMYHNAKPPANIDPASVREVENQYKRLAATEAKAAATAATVADYHSRMAGVVDSPPPVATHIREDDAAFRK